MSTPPPVPARVDVASDGKRARKVSGGDNIKFVPDKREPQGVRVIKAKQTRRDNICKSKPVGIDL